MTDHAEARRLEAVRNLGLLDTPPEERFDRIVRLARRLFDVPAAVVSLVDEHRQFNKAQIGLGISELPISQSFCRFAVNEPDTLVVDDARNDDRFRDNPLVTTEKDPVRFYAGHPLHESSGTASGPGAVSGVARWARVRGRTLLREAGPEGRASAAPL